MTFANVNLQLFEGFWYNCEIFLVTLAAAIPLGLVVAFCTMSKFKPLSWLSHTFVWIIRGTPLMLQVIIVFYGPGLIFDLPMKSRMTAVLIAFIINYAAYFSEIYRGGIQSIPVGQYEACQVLGMTRSQTFFKVVLMQVVKRIVPPMSNEIITLVKDTAIARVVAVGEIIMMAEKFTAKGLIWPLFYTAVFFLAFCGILTLLFRFIERKLDYYKG